MEAIESAECFGAREVFLSCGFLRLRSIEWCATDCDEATKDIVAFRAFAAADLFACSRGEVTKILHFAVRNI